MPVCHGQHENAACLVSTAPCCCFEFGTSSPATPIRPSPIPPTCAEFNNMHEAAPPRAAQGFAIRLYLFTRPAPSSPTSAEFSDIHEASETAANIRLRDVRLRRGAWGAWGAPGGALRVAAAPALLAWAAANPGCDPPYPPTHSPTHPSHPVQSWRKMFTRAYSPMLIVTAMIAMLQQVGRWRALAMACVCVGSSAAAGCRARRSPPDSTHTCTPASLNSLLSGSTPSYVPHTLSLCLRPLITPSLPCHALLT